MSFEFHSSTAGFRTLYSSVTLRLLRRSRLYPPAFSSWLEGLISGFEEEYREWGQADSRVRAYLEMVEYRARNRKWLLLIGHAYLHISYDLPRVIARTLREHPTLDSGGARFIYEELRDTFCHSWTDASRDARVLGSMALAGRLIPGEYVEASIHYVLSLRYQAWSNSEVIRRAGSAAEIRRLEAELLDWAEFYLSEVPVSWNPIRWLAKLQAPLLRSHDDFLLGPQLLQEGPDRPGLTGPDRAN